jgi:aldose 1-epimerase
LKNQSIYSQQPPSVYRSTKHSQFSIPKVSAPMILLKNSLISLGVLPAVGGSFHFISYYCQSLGRWLLMTPKAPHEPVTASDACNFLMAPYSNRIRDGRFRFRGHSYQLSRGDKHAIHGDVRNRPWKVMEQSETSVVLTFDSRDCPDFNYPWKLSCEQRIEVLSAGVRQSVSITNQDKEAFPVGLGFHPYFLRDIFGDSGDIFLTFGAEKVFPAETDIPLPIGPAELVPESLRYARSRRLQYGLDHCFEHWDRRAALEWRSGDEERKIAGEVCASDSCSYLVVYSPQGKNLFAFEPVTHAIDSFNLFDRLPTSSPPDVIEPGENFTSWWQVKFSG